MPSSEPVDGRCGYDLDTQDGFCENLPNPDSENDLCAAHAEHMPEASKGGAPEGNQRATRHGLYADREKYMQNFEGIDMEFIEAMQNDLAERYERIHGREPDMFSREVLRNIAIDLEQIPAAYRYLKKETWVQREERLEEGTLFVDDVPNILLESVRKQNESVIKRMKDLGMLQDPETKKADALKGKSVGEIWDESGEGEGDIIDLEFADFDVADEGDEGDENKSG